MFHWSPLFLYSTFFQIFSILHFLNLFSWFFSFSSWFSPSSSATVLHFPLNLLHLLSLCPPFDLQMNCTLRSWNTRLSARSWIMLSMIWTPCKPCIRSRCFHFFHLSHLAWLEALCLFFPPFAVSALCSFSIRKSSIKIFLFYPVFCLFNSPLCSCTFPHLRLNLCLSYTVSYSVYSVYNYWPKLERHFLRFTYYTQVFSFCFAFSKINHISVSYCTYYQLICPLT